MAEQRYQAVLAVIADGLDVKRAADKVGVSRQTLRSWLARTSANGRRVRPTGRAILMRWTSYASAGA